MGEFIEGKREVLSQIFKLYDKRETGELNAIQVQALHKGIRMGGISMQQVLASIGYVCLGDACEESELFDLLEEMDRRFFLVKDLRWEFSMLDREQSDTITEEQALWFMQSVHGKRFSRRKWDQFVKKRAVPRSGVCFAEIEVELCNIPSKRDLQDEEEEKKRLAEVRKRQTVEVPTLEKRRPPEKSVLKKTRDSPSPVVKKSSQNKDNSDKEKLRKQREADERRKQKLEEERQRRLEEARKAEEEEKRLKEEEENRKRLEEEERRRLEEDEDTRRKRLEAEEEERKRKLLEEQEREERERREMAEQEERVKREAEERKQRELEEAKNAEEQAKDAEMREKEAEEELKMAQKALKDAQDAKSKKEAEELERIAKEKAKVQKEKKIRANLKVAIKSRDKGKLEKGIKAFKDAKLKDDLGMDLATAEKILKQVNARDGLKGAMSKREIEAIEKAMLYVKKNGFENELAPELLEANKLLLNLRRLERIRAEILELKQSTVAEIRSYQTPPIAVHHVMTATFLMLGHAEKETKVWKTVQALVGKTGKEGLKRRCLELNPDKVDLKRGGRAKELLSKYELDEIRDVSAGAATFYCWATSMIEEGEARAEAKKQEEDEKKQAAAAAAN